MSKKLNEQTKIEVGFKHVISFLLGILSIMYGFYSIFIVPKLYDHETKMVKIEEKISTGLDDMNSNLQELYMGIGTLNGNIEGINNRFRDLNNIRTDEGGGFSN